MEPIDQAEIWKTMGTIGKKRKSQWLASSRALVLATVFLSYPLIGGKNSGSVHVNSGVSTEQAAADVGAKVLPTDPKLKIEPK